MIWEERIREWLKTEWQVEPSFANSLIRAINAELSSLAEQIIGEIPEYGSITQGSNGKVWKTTKALKAQLRSKFIKGKE